MILKVMVISFILFARPWMGNASNPCDAEGCSCTNDTLSCECVNGSETLPDGMDMRDLRPITIQHFKVSNCLELSLNSEQLIGKVFKSFEFSKIQTLKFKSHLFDGISMEAIKIKHCHLSIEPYTFIRVNLSRFTIDESEIEQLSENAFGESAVGQLTVTLVRMHNMSNFQYDTTITKFKITNSTIGRIQMYAINMNPISEITLQFNQIDVVETRGIFLFKTGNANRIMVKIVGNTIGKLEDTFLEVNNENSSELYFEKNRVEVMGEDAMSAFGNFAHQKVVIVENNFGKVSHQSLYHNAMGNMDIRQNVVECDSKLCLALRFPLRPLNQLTFFDKIIFKNSSCEQSTSVRPPYDVYSSFQSANQCMAHLG